MKIDIDLSEVFEDEESGVFKPDVSEQIINSAVSTIVKKITDDVKKQISETVQKIVIDGVKEEIARLIPKMLDFEYVETNSWGEKKEPTTVRNQIFKTIKEQCVFQSNAGRYSSDKNQFTQSVYEAVDKKLKEFQPLYNKEVDALLAKEFLDHATTRIKEKLGIKSI